MSFLYHISLLAAWHGSGSAQNATYCQLLQLYTHFRLCNNCPHGLRAVPLGHSLEMVLSNIREDTFAHRAFYIALSRIHRLDDLMLFAIETSPIGGPVIHVTQYHPR